MPTQNIVHLEGVVRRVGTHDCWTRYRPGARGQVRFWIGVPREDGAEDYLLCAIEPATAEELQHIEKEIRHGRCVSLTATARAVGQPLESAPGAIFMAEGCGFDGAPVHDVHRTLRKPRMTGKMAAAGERLETDELPIDVLPCEP